MDKNGRLKLITKNDEVTLFNGLSNMDMQPMKTKIKDEIENESTTIAIRNTGVLLQDPKSRQSIKSAKFLNLALKMKRIKPLIKYQPNQRIHEYKN
ncbi:hypothetical protein [Ulvibacterium sp.]|uniref:hypothetical protein n=1 Tax=Ulvibacterium sp. TaxID=2665914 RepID=UPI003CC5C8C5